MNIREYVYVLKELTNKLGDQYTGPYEVLELLGNHNLKIRLSKTRTKIHIDKIKKLHNAPIPPSPREIRNDNQPSEELADSSTQTHQ